MASKRIKVKIKELGKVVGGATPSTRNPENWEGSIPWLTPKDLANHRGRFIKKGEKSISQKGYESCSTKMLPKGTVLFSSRAPIGYCAIAENDICTNQGFKSIVPNEITDSLFLYYLLKNNVDTIANNASGTTFLEISGKAMEEIEVVIPEDKNEQRQIAQILDAFDRKIENNLKLNDYLASVGELIWKEASISSKLIFKISDVVKNIITGKTPSTKNPEYYGRTYPFITIPDMHSSIWICSSERYLSESGNAIQIKKLVPRGSVLISCIATVGLVGITRTPSHFNQQINAVIAAHEGEEFFLYYALKSIRNELLGIGATGSATLNINRGAFANIEIPWLDDMSMKKYIKEVKPLFDLIENNSMESLSLQRTKEILLSKLLSGDIDVSKIINE